MSKEISKEGKAYPLAWRVPDGRLVELTVPLFQWKNVEMIDIKSLKRSTRLVWSYDGGTMISLFQQARSGSPSGALTEPPEYEILPAKKTVKNPSGFKKTRKRTGQLSGLQTCAIKLSRLCYAENDMSLPISPSSLNELIKKNFEQGNYISQPNSCKFVMLRSNDLRREMIPTKTDRWIVLKTIIPKALQGMIKPINEVEKEAGSPYRLAGQDPRLMQLLEEIQG